MKCKRCQHHHRSTCIQFHVATEPKAFALARHCDCTFVCRNCYGPCHALYPCICECVCALSLSNEKMAGAKRAFDSWTTLNTAEYMEVSVHALRTKTIGSSSKQMMWLETKQQTQLNAHEKEQAEDRVREKQMKMMKKGERMQRKKENQKITKFTTDIRVWRSAISSLFLSSFFPCELLFTCFQYYAMVWVSSTESHCLDRAKRHTKSTEKCRGTNTGTHAHCTKHIMYSNTVGRIVWTFGFLWKYKMWFGMQAFRGLYLLVVWFIPKVKPFAKGRSNINDVQKNTTTKTS